MRCIMTISEWMKSWIKLNLDLKLTSGRHRPHRTQKYNSRHGWKRYLTPKRRGYTVRIGNKCPKRIINSKVICTAFPSLSQDKRSNIRCISHKFSVDSDSFTTSIDNHASTTISNRSSPFVVRITPLKGEMVNAFGGMIQVKGGGTIVWKIEDDDVIVHPVKIKEAIYEPEAW